MSTICLVNSTFFFSDTSHGYQHYRAVYGKVLDVVKPNVVYEWGPGENTQMALEAGATVMSVEQDKQYLIPTHPRLLQLHMPVDHPEYPRPLWPAALYFVDSRRRAECIRETLHMECSRYDPVLVLHDAQRRRYWGALAGYDYVLIPDGCTAIAVNDGTMCERLLWEFSADTLKRMEP